jgi:carotenoid cleavage dioxygenase-like enzyme
MHPSQETLGMDTFRDTPVAFQRNFAPLAFETDLGPLPTTGTIPKGLAGMLLRNGPNPQFPVGDAHWFAGDGMLHAFCFDSGRVRYRNRWVRTRRWQAERAEGRASGPGRRRDDDGVANTNVVAHAGRLLALEEGHLPVALRDASLDTLGTVDFGGRMAGPFTAHPKTDPTTGELVFFGYGTPDALGAGMAYGTLDAGGRLTRLDRFEAPYASMVHDFAITPRHALFPVMPLVASAERAAAGGPPYAWQPEQGTHVGILRRDAPIDSIGWWQAPACYAFHTMNAWEEGGKVVMDVMQSAAPALFTKPDGSPVDEDSDARLCRWTFDLQDSGRAIGMEWLCHIPGEFPRIDERYIGQAHRHGWFVGDGSDGSPFSRIVHVDHEEGRLDTHELPATDCASEAVFVPRSAAAAEGDGWLLAVAYRSRTERSDLLVFDARNVGDGPVAAVHLPHRVPNGFHGNWFEGAAIGAKE